MLSTSSMLRTPVVCAGQGAQCRLDAAPRCAPALPSRLSCRGGTRAGSHLRGGVVALRRRSRSQATSETAVQVVALSTGMVPVTFKVKQPLQFGEVLKVVGGAPQLGNWDAVAAPVMTWTEGDVWMLDTKLPTGSVSFKCVVYNTGSDSAYWEQGADRSVNVEGDKPCAVQCTFGDVDNFDVAVMSSLSDEAVALRSSEANAAEESKLESWGKLPWSMLKESFSSPAQVEQTAAAEYLLYDEEKQAPGNEQQQQQEQQQYDDAQQEQQRYDELDEAKIFVKAMQETLAEVPEELLSGKQDRQSGSWSSGTNTYYSSPSSSSSEAAGGEMSGSSYSSYISGGGEEGGGSVPLWAAAPLALLGLASVPVVVLAEYTLYKTGCGLPPGPGGVTGAVEGLSFLLLGGIFVWSVARKVTTGKGLPGVLGPVEGLAYLVWGAGAVVLALQFKEHGFLPGALPNAQCFPDAASLKIDLSADNARLAWQETSRAVAEALKK